MMKRAFDIIGWLGTALVLAAVAVFFLKPEWQPYSRWLAWGGLVAILIYAIGQWRDILRFFGARQVRFGTISLASVVVVLAILTAIIYISSRQHKRWDLTASSQYSLSPQTVKVLEKLDAPLKMTVFGREVEHNSYRDRLSEYQYVSKKVAVEYVDPDKKPQLARQLQIQQYGTVALQYKERIERVVSMNEQELTNAIIKVTSGQELKVVFTQGHGERETAGSDRSVYSAIAAQIARDNFKLETITLAQQIDVPADATVVVVAGPKVDFLEQEVAALRRYLDKGGKLMLLLDPPEKADAAPLARLVALAHEWAIDVGSGIVLDASGRIGDPTIPVAANYPAHAITERFRLLTGFPLASPITTVSAGVNGRVAQALVETSPNSWVEADLKGVMAGGEIGFDEAKGDRRGPVAIGAAASAPVAGATGDKKPETRVVVFGDSDFVSNAFVGLPGNMDLFMNALNWLGQQENLIAIRPREASDRRLTMTSNQQNSVALLALLVIPVAVFGSGVYAWWRRR